MTLALNPLRVAAAGLGLFFALVVLLHLISPRDARFHLISEYAFEHPLLLGLALLALAIGGLALASGLWRSDSTGARIVAPLLGLSCLGLVGLAAFQTDHEGLGPANSTEGELHNLASAVAFIGILVTELVAAVALPGRWYTRVLRLLALVLLIAAAAVAPRAYEPDWIGFHQRVYAGALLLGLVPLLGALRRASRRRPARE